MIDKLIIFLAIEDDQFVTELQLLIDSSKFIIERYKSDTECINNLHLKPDFLLIDYHLSNNLDIKDKRSVSVIEKIKENQLPTKVFMFSEKQSAKMYIKMLNK